MHLALECVRYKMRNVREKRLFRGWRSSFSFFSHKNGDVSILGNRRPENAKKEGRVFGASEQMCFFARGLLFFGHDVVALPFSLEEGR